MKVTINRVRILFAALAFCLIAAMGVLTERLATASTIQDMRGVWDGFVQTESDPPQPFRTEITGQENRRFTGLTSPPDPVQPIAIEGTVSASGKVNFQGQSSDGSHTVGKTDLTDFGGGAAILNGSLTRFVNDGFIVPCVLVMRPFTAGPSELLPSPAGRYVGTLSSNDAGPTGQIDMVLGAPPDPIRPTSLGGTVDIAIGGQVHTYQLLGTINAEGRFIAIAHTAAGHMILDAVLAAPPDPVQPTTINGTFTLEFHDGSEYEGAFQTELFRSTAS
jgi:hypothetical protein